MKNLAMCLTAIALLGGLSVLGLQAQPLPTEAEPGVSAPEATPAEEPISIDLKGVDISEALRFLFRYTGYSFALDPGVKGKVTVSLKDVSFSAALRAMLDQVQATYLKEDSIYTIKPSASLGAGGMVGERSLATVEAPRKLRVFELRFADSSEIALMFGGKRSGASGGFGSYTGGGGGRVSGAAPSAGLGAGAAGATTTLGGGGGAGASSGLGGGGSTPRF